MPVSNREPSGRCRSGYIYSALPECFQFFKKLEYQVISQKYLIIGEIWGPDYTSIRTISLL